MGAARAVMISHAAGPDGEPASLSREAVATGLLRRALGFDGAAFSDDLEMGALSAFGSLPERCAAASRAGCDLLFICSRIAEYPACLAQVRREVAPARLSEAARRLEGYARHLDEIRVTARLPDRPIHDLIADIASLRSARPVILGAKRRRISFGSGGSRSFAALRMT